MQIAEIYTTKSIYSFYGLYMCQARHSDDQTFGHNYCRHYSVQYAEDGISYKFHKISCDKVSFYLRWGKKHVETSCECSHIFCLSKVLSNDQNAIH